MEQSILHFYAEACKKFFDRLQNGEIADMEKMAESLLEDLKDLTCKLMSVVLEAANLEIREDKDLQKELGLLMQEHDRIRSLLTSIGRIDYARDYYKEKVIKALVNNAYLDKWEFISKKADEIREKEDKLCFDFLKELNK